MIWMCVCSHAIVFASGPSPTGRGTELVGQDVWTVAREVDKAQVATMSSVTVL